jgi:metal-responsive CopG/Arc/MetJ family transcriptional regulator
MKTAISLPDDLFRAGDALAKRMKVSRSELYARALAEYVAKHRADRLTQRLNAVYAAEDSALEPGLAQLQARALPRDEW